MTRRKRTKQRDQPAEQGPDRVLDEVRGLLLDERCCPVCASDRPDQAERCGVCHARFVPIGQPVNQLPRHYVHLHGTVVAPPASGVGQGDTRPGGGERLVPGAFSVRLANDQIIEVTTSETTRGRRIPGETIAGAYTAGGKLWVQLQDGGKVSLISVFKHKGRLCQLGRLIELTLDRRLEERPDNEDRLADRSEYELLERWIGPRRLPGAGADSDPLFDDGAVQPGAGDHDFGELPQAVKLKQRTVAGAPELRIQLHTASPFFSRMIYPICLLNMTWVYSYLDASMAWSSGRPFFGLHPLTLPIDLLSVLVIVLSLYLTIMHIFGRMTLVITPTQLRVGHLPLPFPYHRKLAIDEVGYFQIESLSYMLHTLHVVLNNGQQIPLVAMGHPEARLKWLMQALQAELGR